MWVVTVFTQKSQNITKYMLSISFALESQLKALGDSDQILNLASLILFENIKEAV